MKKLLKNSLTIAVAALTSVAVFASDTGRDSAKELQRAISSSAYASSKTRQSVLDELTEAQRTGDIVVTDGNASSGKKLNELHPERYPAQAVVTGKTRQQVLDELAEAQRTGDIVVTDENASSGKKLNELHPERYPAQAVVTGKTRQQVLDELTESQRSGEANSRFADQIFN